jgi:MFS family permease
MYHPPGTEKRSPKQIFRNAIIRPLKMLFFSPIIALIALQAAISYGYLYILFTTFVFVFRDQYGFGSGAAGLAYLGLGVGFMIGLVVTGATSDRIAGQKAAGSTIEPEHRLPPLFIGSILVPIGLFWYGWAAEKQVHWIVPIIGTVPMGLGVMLVYMTAQLYLIDAFTVYAASAIAASTVTRSLFGALLPLAGPPMYEKLGLGWGNSLLAFIAVGTIPLVYLLMKNGERIRQDPRFQVNL